MVNYYSHELIFVNFQFQFSFKNQLIEFFWLVLSATTMVSRSATDRQVLNLQNVESATAWIIFFVAKCCAEKKEDKVNTDGAIEDLNVTNLFFSMCGQDARLLNLGA